MKGFPLGGCFLLLAAVALVSGVQHSWTNGAWSCDDLSLNADSCEASPLDAADHSLVCQTKAVDANGENTLGERNAAIIRVPACMWAGVKNIDDL